MFLILPVFLSVFIFKEKKNLKRNRYRRRRRLVVVVLRDEYGRLFVIVSRVIFITLKFHATCYVVLCGVIWGYYFFLR